MKFVQFILSFGIIIVIGCQSKDEMIPQADEDLKLGGETSTSGSYIQGFQQPAANLSELELELHRKSDKAFGDIFVTAPSTINGGLGPIFNQNSCENCHVSNGRSPFPDDINDLRGLLIRLSIDGTGIYGEPKPVPNFGGQLQTKAIFGKNPEAKLAWNKIEEIKTFLDGEQIKLSKPMFTFNNPYVSMPPNILYSPRIAPPIIGLGLIEAIKESDLLANEDLNDADKDGISGKANRVWDNKNSAIKIGRFGWKAGQPSLLQQTAAAYNQDMGITNPYFKIESSYGQQQNDFSNDDPEIDELTLKSATFYPQSVAVPQRRNTTDPTVIYGKKLFLQIKCGTCHHPKYITGQHSEYAFLSNQIIFPYSDFLLHDMGDGLADNRQEFDANGKEWRTPPLWGVGLTKIVGGDNANYLHDGRANTLEEAIMWHGGESENSKESFRKLNKSDRNAIIKFLESL